MSEQKKDSRESPTAGGGGRGTGH